MFDFSKFHCLFRNRNWLVGIFLVNNKNDFLTQSQKQFWPFLKSCTSYWASSHFLHLHDILIVLLLQTIPQWSFACSLFFWSLSLHFPKCPDSSASTVWAASATWKSSSIWNVLDATTRLASSASFKLSSANAPTTSWAGRRTAKNCELADKIWNSIAKKIQKWLKNTKMAKNGWNCQRNRNQMK